MHIFILLFINWLTKCYASLSEHYAADVAITESTTCFHYFFFVHFVLIIHCCIYRHHHHHHSLKFYLWCVIPIFSILNCHKTEIINCYCEITEIKNQKGICIKMYAIKLYISFLSFATYYFAVDNVFHLLQVTHNYNTVY